MEYPIKSRHYKLSGHHLANLVDGYENEYKVLKDALMRIATEDNGVKRRHYTDQDAETSRCFYSEIALNPQNTLEITKGPDDRCGLCSNYDGIRCILFPNRNLKLEDKRTLKKKFPGLKVGDIITAADIIPYGKGLQ
jgi:hypothetical protein